MGRLARGIKRRVVDMLSLDMISEKYQVLAVNYIFLMLYITLESVFVNTLLYTVREDISIVIFYRGTTFISSAVTMHLAAYLSQVKSPTVTIKAGACLFMLVYILLFFGMDHMDKIMYFTAFLTGMGGAFYWSGHNQLVPHYTTVGNRDISISILGIIQGVMTLIVPVVSGSVISYMPGATGYRVMFGVGMLAVAAQLWVQRRLAPVEKKKHVSRARLAFRLLRRKLSFKLMMAYEYMRGFRDGAFGFIMNMLLFSIVTNEMYVGVNTFMAGVAAIVGSGVYSRVVRQNMRSKITIASAAVLTVFCLPLFMWMSALTVMAFSLMSAFVTLFILNSCNNMAFDVMGQNDTAWQCMGEMGAIREGALTAGRISGLCVLMVLPQNQRGYASSILLLTVSQLAVGALLALTLRALNRKGGGEAAS